MHGAGVEHRVVGTLHHRSIIEILRDKVRSETDGPHFHYQPYYMDWGSDETDGSSTSSRVYSELYTSDAFMEAHEELQRSPQVPGCTSERVIAGLMFWSDMIKLTEFGPTKLWPCYMFFGNESKYRHVKTNLHLGEHVAYFDSLSDDFKDYLRKRAGGKLPPADLIMHCGREMFHAQWAILLDQDLIDAMTNGVVLLCHDGIERRFYPRIFTYSADYPEKVAISLIKQGGAYPCTRCLISKSNLHNMGLPEDEEFRKAHPRLNDRTNQIMLSKALKDVKAGFSVTGDKVGHMARIGLCFPFSAFHSHLKELDFDIFPALVVDLLHEFKIGVWKSTFKHLIQLLLATKGGQAVVAKFDQR
ncbi:hypothetical protein FA15DRAFT_605762 [Coprinopsis marcescibilis]|uniref:Uncharacterized protein n=1 Tax=Coprinopsis marcescibilis TaxID=230819 RepID=A0A5C3KAJ6_COPMA|nr:hypothetical protein FA15DRAFT_605762 [Coprinopsis marcescibilis]